MLKNFQKYINDKKLLTAGDKILLAVSGGGDSMAMTDLFLRSGYMVTIAHCNFSLRGEESDSDQALVEEFAERHGVRLHTIRFDTRREASENGESIQMAARRLRYGWFEELCIEHGYDRVAVAHHGDDSAETFFVNLLRGTGLRGLTGISNSNGRIVRPLLFATSDEISTYLAERQISYATDSSNAQTKYLRNRLRHDIIPRLGDAIPQPFTQTMAENMLRLEQAQQFIDSQIARISREAFDGKNIDLGVVEREGNVNFVLFEMLRPYGFSAEVIAELTEAIGRSGRRFVGGSYEAIVDRGRIIIEKLERDHAVERLLDRDDEAVEWIDASELETLKTTADVALLSADELQFPLELRSWKAGDSFVPLGMSGRKKVSDYLIDTKVPLTEKERQLVLCSAGQIVWLVGRRIDDRYRVTEQTQRIIRVTL